VSVDLSRDRIHLGVVEFHGVEPLVVLLGRSLAEAVLAGDDAGFDQFGDVGHQLAPAGFRLDGHHITRLDASLLGVGRIDMEVIAAVLLVVEIVLPRELFEQSVDPLVAAV